MVGMTVSDVIEALGGTSAAAKMFGVRPSAVSNWKSFGRFPDRVHHRVFLECQSRGIDLPPELLAPADRDAA